MAGFPALRSPTAALLCCLLTLAGCGGTARPASPTGGTAASTARAAGAARLLTSLTDGLGRRDRGEVTALAAPDPASRRALAAIYANAVSLRLSHLGLRYLDPEQATVAPRVSSVYGDRAWAADVRATWRISGYDRHDTRLSTRFTFVDTDRGVRLAAAGDGGARGALWLAGPVRVSRGPHALVLAADGQAERVPGLAERAVDAVHQVLPGWRGPLVVEVPGSPAQLETLLGAHPGEYAAIAAVTTTVDGSLTHGTPVHVYVNPRVLDRLGPRGAEVVLSHEATHVATGAAFASMPTWLLEGFADYVALAHAGVPLQTAASQILRRVRRHGAPRRLPTGADLDPSAPGLGATYEEAWTVCRFIAETYGARALVALYDAVDRGSSQASAFRTVLGTGQQDLVARWRADLARIARD